LFAQVPKVAAARVGTPAVVVAQLARGHDAERAGGRQGAAFRPAKGVLAATRVMHNVALLAAGEIEVTHECVTGIASALVSFARAFVGPVACA
jgi:hypothetical protein